MLLRFFRRLHYLLNRRRYEAELAEEMAFREETLVSWRSAEDAVRGAA